MENSTDKTDRPDLKSILTSAVFVLLLLGAFLFNLLMPKAEVLQSERRRPAQWPKFSVDTLLSSEFMEGFSKYASDNFVLRDQLRTLRAAIVFDVFLQTDKSGLYKDPVAGAGKFEGINEASMQKAAEKINKLCALFPELDVYYSVIPDKSIYAERYYPGYDPNKANSILAGPLGNLTFIDLADALSADDFYTTDLHWDQGKIAGVAGVLGQAMGFSDRLDTGFEPKSAGSFHGVYTGQLALPLVPDEMVYLTSGILDDAKVLYFNPAADAWEPGPMYDVEAASGRDPYDIFLKGVQPLIIIENPHAKTDRQLYLFRDSFGSSLAPLLASAYARITIIDMRYIDSRVLEQYVGMQPALARRDMPGEPSAFELAVGEYRNFTGSGEFTISSDYEAIHKEELRILDEMAIQRKKTSDYMMIAQLEKIKLLEKILEAKDTAAEELPLPRGRDAGAGYGFAKENADVLFLYSSQILNNSSSLLIN